MAIASCVVAAACFHALACGTATRRRVIAASVLFAAGTVVNVAVGRLTFALGLTAGLAALVALRRGHLVVGAVLTALTAPASPVAGALLALVLAAWAIDTRRIRLAVLALLAVAPIAVTAAAFPEHGPFPFRAAALLWSVVVAGIVAAWTTARVVRIAAALFAGACVLMFLVPNPVGANATRFGMFFAAPVLVLTGRRVRTPLVAVAVAAMLWWQWSPAVDGIQLAGRDPSASAAFHEPLIAAIRDSPGGGRVEVVPTRHHWEAFHVASELPLARWLGAPAGPRTQRAVLRRRARRDVVPPVAAGPGGRLRRAGRRGPGPVGPRRGRARQRRPAVPASRCGPTRSGSCGGWSTQCHWSTARRRSSPSTRRP